MQNKTNALQTFCFSVHRDNLCCLLINVDQTLTHMGRFSKVCLSVFLSDIYHFLSLFPETKRSNLGFSMFHNSLCQPHHSMTNVMQGMYLRLLHNLISRSYSGRRLIMKVRRIFHSYLLHKLNCALMFSVFSAQPRQTPFDFPFKFFRLYFCKFNTLSFILQVQTFKLQLGHVMLFLFLGPCLSVLDWCSPQG